MILYSSEKFIWIVIVLITFLSNALTLVYSILESPENESSRHYQWLMGLLTFWGILLGMQIASPNPTLHSIFAFLQGVFVLPTLYCALLYCTLLKMTKPHQILGKIASLFLGTLLSYAFFQNTAITQNIQWLYLLFTGLAIGHTVYSLLTLNPKLLPTAAQAALKELNCLIVATDAKGQILYHNKRTYLHGALELNSLNTITQLEESFNKLALDHHSLSGYQMYQGKDGHSFALKYTAKPLHSSRYRSTGALHQWLDVTEHHQLLIKLQQSRKELAVIHHQLKEYSGVARHLAAQQELSRIEDEIGNLLIQAFQLSGSQLKSLESALADPHNQSELILSALESLADELRNILKDVRSAIHEFAQKEKNYD